jgi:hypothetical protein
MAWAAVAVFAVAYTLIATEEVHRVAAATGDAASPTAPASPSRSGSSQGTASSLPSSP